MSRQETSKHLKMQHQLHSAPLQYPSAQQSLLLSHADGKHLADSVVAQTMINEPGKKIEQERFAEAEAFFREVLRISPEFDDSLANSLAQSLCRCQESRKEPVAVCADTESVQEYEKRALQTGISLHNAGQLDEAICWYKKVLELNAENVVAMSNFGIALQDTGKLEEGIALSRQAILLKPDCADAHYNLANGLAKNGQLKRAMTSYQQAIAIKPDFVDAHNNLGNILKELGEYDQAVTCYQHAISLQPDYAEAYHNMGVSLYLLGKPDQAVVCYQHAISLKENYAEAYSNLGIALYDLDQEELAVASYQKAISIKPDYAEAMYNFHAILCDTDPASAMALLEQAVEHAPYDRKIRFFMNLLQDYTQGAGFLYDDAAYDQAVDGLMDSWHFIQSRGKPFPVLFGTTKKGLRLGLEHAHVEGLVLEFGVRHGATICQIAAQTKQAVHGFDSFQGLPEAWHGNQPGRYSTDGLLPTVPDTVSLHVGLFAETLPDFLEKERGPVRFINIDCDLYSSTKTILNLLEKRIVAGTVIVFDEYFANKSWREDEYKAFQEAVKQFGWSYEYIAFSLFSKQAVIIIK